MRLPHYPGPDGKDLASYSYIHTNHVKSSNFDIVGVNIAAAGQVLLLIDMGPAGGNGVAASFQ